MRRLLPSDPENHWKLTSPLATLLVKPKRDRSPPLLKTLPWSISLKVKGFSFKVNANSPRVRAHVPTGTATSPFTTVSERLSYSPLCSAQRDLLVFSEKTWHSHPRAFAPAVSSARNTFPQLSCRSFSSVTSSGTLSWSLSTAHSLSPPIHYPPSLLPSSPMHAL